MYKRQIKTLAYAGLGLASEANEKFKERFDELVEAGKEKDASGKNLIGDFFKTVESSKEDFEAQLEKMKNKLERLSTLIRKARRGRVRFQWLFLVPPGAFSGGL